MHFRDCGNALEWRANGATLRVEAWVPDAVRVRATPGGPVPDDLPGAPLDPPPGGKAEIVTAAGAGERAVHLPAGARWTDAWTGQEHVGGQAVTAAPIEHIPLFVRDDARLPLHEEKA